MCKCTPDIRTPWCGRPGCKEPVVVAIDPDNLIIHSMHWSRCIVCAAVAWKGEGPMQHEEGCALGGNPPKREPALTPDEWDALSLYHNDQEHECVRRQEYLQANIHKNRHEQIKPFTSYSRAQARKVVAKEASDANH
jgi:hypothetical protein